MFSSYLGDYWMPSTATTLKCWTKTRGVLLLLLILALASFLRIYDLGAESIWLDEAHSATVSSQDFASVIAGAASGQHPPLYFVTPHSWINLFGSSEVSLRAMSAMFGILSVLIIYWVRCVLFKRRVSLISSLLSSISLFHIRYSQKIRGLYPAAILYTTIVSVLHLCPETGRKMEEHDISLFRLQQAFRCY